ncbi:FAD-dependent oxidoreductase [Candidatus Poribacteria bacterium]|nr:FAD-dependent oxidoreductase [Candidatus Poribacteria bacterium]
MSKTPTFVILGSSTAGAFAAVTLRKEGFAGRVILIGEEKEIPYARPPLSKQYLQRERERERLHLWPNEFYSERKIELRLGARARRVIPREKEIEMENGERLRFDHLLIATGMAPRRLALPGSDLPNIFYLRTLEDSDRIAEACQPGSRAVIIGGGFIGMEVAASLRQKQVDVAVIHRDKVALERAIGIEAGRILTEYHRQEGVNFYPEAEASEIEGNGRAERLHLRSGHSVECDNVIVGIGATPRIETLEGSGIETNNGILVDEFCRTNIEGISAAGDVAHFRHPRIHGRIHVEHWDNARLHGIAAANNMLGRHIPYSPVPFFWSDQFDVNIQYAGFPLEWSKSVHRGSTEEQSFSAFMLGGNKLVAGVCFNRWKDRRVCEKLLSQDATVDPAKLRDEEFDLEGFL